MLTNIAAWLPSKGAPLQVGPAPMPEAAAGQIIVRARAIAVNPVDWIVQRLGGLFFGWLRYPVVLGWDVAGEVTAVGPSVTRFAPGDRVVGLAVGQDKQVNSPAEGAFQHHVLLREQMAAPLPASMSWEAAAVLPLGLATAACALFQKRHLGLSHPTASQHPAGGTVLVWGGSTSVGSNAIQLAAAAGYEVISTASPRNHGYLRGLGASRVFDYNSPAAVREIIAAMDERQLAGVVAVGTGSAKPCVEVAGACVGSRVVVMTSPPVSFAEAPLGGGRASYLLRIMPRMIAGTLRTMLRARRLGVRTRFVDGVSLLHDEVGPMIFADFLPQALASGRFRPAPDPIVVGTGLTTLPEALDRQRRGVSAAKIVVALP